MQKAGQIARPFLLSMFLCIAFKKTDWLPVHSANTRCTVDNKSFSKKGFLIKPFAA